MKPVNRVRNGLDRKPMKLNALSSGNVHQTASMISANCGNGADLGRVQAAIGNGHAKHEILARLSFAPLAAQHPKAITLGVDPPPFKIKARPFRQNARAPLTSE